MDRRRFVPSSEGLEGRELLSTTSASNLLGFSAVASTTTQKTLRVDRLPYYLQRIETGRTLPTNGVVSQIQADLTALEGTLHRPPSQVVQDFNLQLRNVIGHASLSASDARALNLSFGRVLKFAGAPPQTLANLQDNMNQLAQYDANSANPLLLATNDYATVLQTALGVGLPIPQPAVPQLSQADDTGNKGDHATSITQPYLVGTYSPGATIEIIDPSSGQVLGSTVTNNAGNYSVQFSEPLSPGLHTFQIRALQNNQVSPPSRSFILKILGPTPQVTTSAAVPQGPRA